jgi:hypothetical protein
MSTDDCIASPSTLTLCDAAPPPSFTATTKVVTATDSFAALSAARTSILLGV